jgi:hypothetical protein
VKKFPDFFTHLNPYHISYKTLYSLNSIAKIMAKSKAKKQMQVARRRQPQLQSMPRSQAMSRVTRNMMTGLDEQARCWARLLNDPCNAPLCHPVYSGSNGGILLRCCNYSSLTASSSQTALNFTWAPGLGGAIAVFAATDVTAVALPSLGTGFIPGTNYLVNNAGSFRAVAACLKVTWGGTELNRQGYLRFGNVNFSDVGIPGTTTTTVANISTLLEASCRVPEDGLEVKWRPTDFDQQTCNPNNSDSSQDYGRRGSICLNASALPPSSTLILETTAVYEYQPVTSLGVTAATASTTRSHNTLDHVIEALDNTGTWMYKIGHVASQVANIAVGAYSAYMNPAGAVLGAANRIMYKSRAQIMG